MKYDSIAKSRYNYRLNYIHSSTVTSVTSSPFLFFFSLSFFQKNHPNLRYTTLRDERWNEWLVPFWKVTTSTWPVRCPGVNSFFSSPTFSTVALIALLFILGRPKPTVVWWKDGKVLDAVVDTHSIGSSSKFTVNRLFINEVTRSLWGTKLECRAQSEQMSAPIIREVPLDIYRK